MEECALGVQQQGTVAHGYIDGDVEHGHGAGLSGKHDKGHWIAEPGVQCKPINLAVSTAVSCTAPNNNTVMPTFPLVDLYASSISAFQAAFPVSFVKMTTVGYGQTNAKLGTVTPFDPTTCPARRELTTAHHVGVWERIINMIADWW